MRVALTVYKDEQCLGDTVREFLACPLVHRVAVVANNFKDRLSVTWSRFWPHMLIEVLKLRMRVIEIPVVFRKNRGYPRVWGWTRSKR